MKKEYCYEFVVNGVVMDRVTEDSKEGLIKCIKAMKWEDDYGDE